MSRTFRLAAAAAVLAAASFAQASEPNRPATAPVDMSASDVGVSLSRMLLDKPKVPITAPEVRITREKAPPLPLEGSMVIDRLCRLGRDPNGDWAVLEFEPEKGRRNELSRRVLPSELLEQMESLTAKTPSIRFRVSGETTVYGQHGYLLLTKATVLDAAPAGAAPGPAAKPLLPSRLSKPTPLVPKALRVAPEPAPATSGPAKPTTRPAGGGEPTSTDILNQLLQDNVGRPIRVPTPSPKPVATPSVAPGAGKPLTAEIGAMIVDRLVRIVPEPAGPWWQARFEADNTLQEPPMRLQPSGFLVRATSIVAAAGVGREPVLRVSGLVTRYKQQRYLLLRKVTVERRLGRF